MGVESSSLMGGRGRAEGVGWDEAGVAGVGRPEGMSGRFDRGSWGLGPKPYFITEPLLGNPHTFFKSLVLSSHTTRMDAAEP